VAGFADVKKLFDELGINPLAQPTPAPDDEGRRAQELEMRRRQQQQDLKEAPPAPVWGAN